MWKFCIILLSNKLNNADENITSLLKSKVAEREDNSEYLVVLSPTITQLNQQPVMTLYSNTNSKISNQLDKAQTEWLNKIYRYAYCRLIVVTLLSGHPTLEFFGFFLQARKPDDNTMSYGTFDVTENTLAQTLNCFGQNNVSCCRL